MSFEALRTYVREKLPMLDMALRSLHKDEVRQVLNVATGLNVSPGDKVTDGSDLFLKAFKAEEARGTLILSALPRGLKAAKKIKGLK